MVPAHWDIHCCPSNTLRSCHQVTQQEASVVWFQQRSSASSVVRLDRVQFCSPSHHLVTHSLRFLSLDLAVSSFPQDSSRGLRVTSSLSSRCQSTLHQGFANNVSIHLWSTFRQKKKNCATPAAPLVSSRTSFFWPLPCCSQTAQIPFHRILMQNQFRKKKNCRYISKKFKKLEN